LTTKVGEEEGKVDCSGQQERLPVGGTGFFYEREPRKKDTEVFHLLSALGDRDPVHRIRPISIVESMKLLRVVAMRAKIVWSPAIESRVTVDSCDSGWC
jgi:hypothetical protein